MDKEKLTRLMIEGGVARLEICREKYSMPSAVRWWMSWTPIWSGWPMKNR